MKVKITFVAILLCLLLPCLAACGNNDDVFDKYAEKGFTCRVVYDFGDGLVDGKSSLLYLVPQNSLLPELGVTTSKPTTSAPVLAGHHVDGYYVKDADGNERDWNFSTDRVTEDITLYTRWKPDYAVKVLYGDRFEQSYSLEVNADTPLNSFRQASWTGHTFYGFYEDPAFTTPVTFPYTPAVSTENPTVTVYARYLEGNYTIVRKASDFGNAIRPGVNYYIDADVDLSDTNISMPDTYSGRFIGNGHTVSGIHVTRTQTRNSEYYGLFGKILRTAVFENITFADVNVRVDLSDTQNNLISQIGMLAGSAETGATFTNVQITGALTYCCYGKDLEGLLEIGDIFGYIPADISLDTVTATVTVTEIPAPTETE